MTMHVLGRPGIARHAGKILPAVGVAVLAGMAVTALPAAAKTQNPTYTVNVVLSGKNLHHWYTKGALPKRYSEALSSPDDLTMLDGHLFTAFQNGVGPQGQAAADGNPDSTVVEFTTSGAVVHQWDLRGKIDGLTADRRSGRLVATVNEDANSSLYTIRPSAGLVSHYVYDKPLAHHGGTDAISFDNGRMLVSASAPGTTGKAAPQPGYPAVYVVSLNKVNHVANTHPLFYDESRATAANGPHFGHPVTLGLTDPDSDQIVPSFEPRFAGDFMLTSQGDKEQIYVSAPGTKKQHLWVLDLSQSVDDTAWSTSWHGSYFATSTRNDTVDVIKGSFWPGTAFVSVTPCDASNAPATCPGPGFGHNYLGQLNMVSGHITAVSVRGAALHPQGLIFVAS